MEITMYDGVKYNLGKEKSYEERLKLVNEIIEKYNNYFNTYWEGRKNNNGSVSYKVKTTLDILGGYLLYADDFRKCNKDNILTERQIKTRREENEILFDYNDENVESLLNNFKEQHKKISPKKNSIKYSKSAMHRLNTIFIPVEKRKNKIIKENPMDFKLDKKERKYKPIDYMTNIEINCFTRDDLKLPYIDSSTAYCSKWCYVDNDGSFKFHCFDYKIENYEADFILILCQKEQRYFLDININLIDNSKLILEGINNCFLKK